MVDDPSMRALGGQLGRIGKAGDVFLLDGPLGAGKTTLVRGVLESFGFLGAVRSPTFNLIQTFDTAPPVMHADLYRVSSFEGIGLEDYLETHLCFIEWPDRVAGLLNPKKCWRVHIKFEESTDHSREKPNPSRIVRIFAPNE